MTGACRHCASTDLQHQEEHDGFCCDCFDLSFGMPIERLNEERAAKGLPPLAPFEQGERRPGDCR